MGILRYNRQPSFTLRQINTDSEKERSKMNIPMNNSYIEVDMQILRENMASIASTLTPGAGIIPVLKDDAYGLGLVPVARVLEPLDCVRCFSVSHVSEGLELRRGGISKGILELRAPLPA